MSILTVQSSEDWKSECAAKAQWKKKEEDGESTGGKMAASGLAQRNSQGEGKGCCLVFSEESSDRTRVSLKN